MNEPERLPAFDDELDTVEEFFLNIPDLERRAGVAIRRAIDEVIDGPRTGRWDIAQLEKTEKTYIGTKVEIQLRAEFELPHGEMLDCNINGVELDIKYTIGNNWTIPGEAVEQLCLLVKGNDIRSEFSLGVTRTTRERLNLGRNRDGKATLNAEGRESIRWMVDSGALPENLLLHLPSQIRDRVMNASRSGNQRVRELFRLVQNRLITRETIEAVAQQRDPMRRARQARTQLLEEGIVVICGTYEYQRREALMLGIPVPQKDEWISTEAPDGWVPQVP